MVDWPRQYLSRPVKWRLNRLHSHIVIFINKTMKNTIRITEKQLQEIVGELVNEKDSAMAIKHSEIGKDWDAERLFNKKRGKKMYIRDGENFIEITRRAPSVTTYFWSEDQANKANEFLMQMLALKAELLELTKHSR